MSPFPLDRGLAHPDAAPWFVPGSPRTAPATHPASDERFPRPAQYIRSLDQIPQLSREDKQQSQTVAERFVFRASDYYLGLIDWTDPQDPIRRLIIPQAGELGEDGPLDPCDEQAVTVARGVQHKYRDTVLLLCNAVCGGYCRYCFRKRLFLRDNTETTWDVGEALTYISSHPEVSNVLLTGGDPLLLSTDRLRTILAELRRISHVKIIRIGSKLPAFDPYRVIADHALLDALREFSTAEKRIYVMAHFDHPRELTKAAVACIECLIGAGVICANQCPLIRGVNDDADVLAELFQRLSCIGCPPYYVFQCRPTAGNEPFRVPLVHGYGIFSRATHQGSGLAARARFCMSHKTGKIHILHVDGQYIYLMYHRARNPEDQGRFFVCHRDEHAYWLDELRPAHSNDERARVSSDPCILMPAAPDEGAIGDQFDHQ